MALKEQRHQAIKELITNHAIDDQQELVKKLHELYGIETNQSIISRDLKILGIGKRTIQGKTSYELENHDIREDIMRNAVLNITHNETMIVIKTLPALADFTAEFIDRQNIPEIIGTLAGENTVFVIPASTQRIKEIYEKACLMLFYKHTKD